MGVFFRLCHALQGKSFRIFVIFTLTISTAIIEIVFGIRSHSQSLIADGLYSFAEGISLIGVLLALHHARKAGKRQNNTFGWARLELLVGLLQEIFLLSLSLGIIVDAVNHLVNPTHVNDPVILIALGILGCVVGILGMLMFKGYHHNHDIEDEINEHKKIAFVASVHSKLPRKNRNSFKDKQKQLLTDPSSDVAIEKRLQNDFDDVTASSPLSPSVVSYRRSIRDASMVLPSYSYEEINDVENFEESRVYATLHALCLHSQVRMITATIGACLN
ncbi:unnamed protein product [Didymodactylos carnosus]|uniref:Cation efflux protein transmembrane domain-containing protein n=1 Tax=Didymodactylos carnosus TaxID=1234261 RepID=A0A814FV49_9BILA|nr:unnamed protein product [Didymodactylos carnosus]CAF0988817.1 unnamed protein product [Didymodactylos carnosus]CAF3660148.1 unnamed protein product [Didymodactylos carnosus]CAF3760953.1 unnamed protein product [Didymodactylos carnosus]